LVPSLSVVVYWLLMVLNPLAECGMPPHVRGGSTSPDPGSPLTWESLNSPTGACPAPRHPRSQVMGGTVWSGNWGWLQSQEPIASSEPGGRRSLPSPLQNGSPGARHWAHCHMQLPCFAHKQLPRLSGLRTSPSRSPAGTCVSVSEGTGSLSPLQQATAWAHHAPPPTSLHTRGCHE
jgi:hypothetical protein